MKTKSNIVVLSLLGLLVLSGCGSTRKVFEDNVYFNLDDADREARTYNGRNQTKTDPDIYSNQNSGTTQDGSSTSGNTDYTTNENGDIIIRNSHYDDKNFSSDDYYDYTYSSRLRRFQDNNGWNYYDPYYTNTYWYTGNPYSFGNSIYNSYSWWGPGYGYNYNYNYWNMSYGWGSGWGGHPWGNVYYNPWTYGGYGGWYYPYGGYGGWWNSPWCPYSMPTYGIWNNNYCTTNFYYNSYDNNSYYYGPRQPNTSGTVSFSRIMQDHGIQQDLTVRPVYKNPHYDLVNRQVDVNKVNNTSQAGGVVNGDAPMTTTGGQNSSTGVTPSNADKYTGLDRNNSTTRTTATVTNRDNNTIIISNTGGNNGTTQGSGNTNSGGNYTNTNSGNTNNSVNRYSTNGSNYSPNTSSMRKWDNTNNDVIIIDRNENSGQRSGNFSEGSRSSSYTNGDFYNNNTNGGNTYTPNSNNRNGGTETVPNYNNSNRNGRPPR